jgi:hypothetical protein
MATDFEKNYIEYETPEPQPQQPKKRDNKMARGWHQGKKKPENAHRYIKGIGLCTVFPYGDGYKVAADGQFYGPFPTQQEARFAAEKLAPPKQTSFTGQEDW